MNNSDEDMLNLVRKHYPKYLTHIWQDEIEDTFLLCKYGEIYPSVQSNHVTVLTICKRLAKKYGSLTEPSTDDGLYKFDLRIGSQASEALLKEHFSNSRRLRANSKTITNLKMRLGHQIIPMSLYKRSERSRIDAQISA